MNTKIAKEFYWEMSHRLPFHDGPCKNIHGHSYKMVVELEGTVDSNSMVLDYYEIERIFRPLLNRLDHTFICDAGDDLMIDFLDNNGFKYLVIPYYTTAENLVTYFIEFVKPKFVEFKNIEKIKLRIYETKDAYAERTEIINEDN